MKRDATQTIWRTVVFAGAMLGAPACTKKTAQQTTPTNNATPAASDTAPATTGDTSAQTPADPAPTGEPTADPCAGGDERPRGTDDDFGGGGVGRGFVLS
jgi:hypothetical protein